MGWTVQRPQRRKRDSSIAHVPGRSTLISMLPDPRLLVGWFRCVSTVGIACNLQVMETTLLVAQRQSRSSLAHFLRTDPPPSSRIFLPGLDSADVYTILACSLPLGGVFCICPVWAPHCRLRTSAPSTGSRESANWGMSNLQNLRLVPSTCLSVELPVLSYLERLKFPSSPALSRLSCLSPLTREDPCFTPVAVITVQ